MSERKQFVERSVEQQFLALVCQEPTPSIVRTLRAVDPSYLQTPAFQWFVPQLQKYLKEETGIPPWEVADVLIGRDYADEEERKATRAAIWLLYTMKVEWGAWAVEDFRQFLSWRIYAAGFVDTQEGYSRSREMREALNQAQDTLNRSRTVLQDPGAHDLADDFEEREAAWIREDANPGLRNRLVLGIPELDKQLKLVEGTSTAFLAVFKRYKSIALNHCGVCALVTGLNVAQIIYENEVPLTEDRYYSRLSAIRLDDLVSMKMAKANPERYEQARNFIKGLKTHLHNRLKIIEATPKVTTVADVEAQLEVLEATEKFVPDVTIWDYANLIGVEKERSKREERLDQETVIWDLQEHAKDKKHGGARKKIVVTAVQAKAEALKAEHLDMSHFGKSIGIPQALEAIIGINQTRQERDSEKLRFSVLFSRVSKVGDEVPVECRIDWMCIDRSTWGWVHDKAKEQFMKRM